MSLTKKEQEMHYFGRFCEAFNLSPSSVTQLPPPATDIIAIIENKKIGVEITAFYKEDGSYPLSEQRQSIRRESITRLAQSKFLASNGRKIEISLGYGLIQREKTDDEIAEAISHYVKEIQNLPTDQYKAVLNIPEVIYLWLNSNEQEDPIWKSAQVHDVSLLNTSRLAHIIAAKEKKHYVGCDEYWLLIVIDPLNPAQDQSIENIKTPHVQFEKFKKVFIYQLYFENIIELSR